MKYTSINTNFNKLEIVMPLLINRAVNRNQVAYIFLHLDTINKSRLITVLKDKLVGDYGTGKLTFVDNVDIKATIKEVFDLIQ